MSLELLYIIGDTHIGRQKISNNIRINENYTLFKNKRYSHNFGVFHIQKTIERFKEHILRDILNLYSNIRHNEKIKIKIIFLGDFFDNPIKDYEFLNRNPKLKKSLIDNLFGKFKKIRELLDNIEIKFYFLFGNHETLYTNRDKNIKTSMYFLTNDIIKKYNFKPDEFEIISEKKTIFFDYSSSSNSLFIFIPFISNNLNEVRKVFYVELKRRIQNLENSFKQNVKNVFIFTHNNIFVNEKWFNRYMISFSEFEKNLISDEFFKSEFPNLKEIKFFNGHIHKYWIEDKLNIVGSFFPLYYKETLKTIGLYKIVLENDLIIEDNGIYNDFTIFVKHLLNEKQDIETFLKYMFKYEFINRERLEKNLYPLSVISYTSFDIENIKIGKIEKYNLLKECSNTIAYYEKENLISNLDTLF